MSINFETATAQELIAWKVQNAEELAQAGVQVSAQLDGIIAQRSAEEGIKKGLLQHQKLQSGKQWDTQAEKDWPELKDKESELYKKTVAAMEEDPNASLEDPYAMYNHATRIGISLGMLPAGSRPERDASNPMDDIGAGDGASGEAGKSAGEKFLEKESTKKIADAYSDLIDMKDEKVRERIAQNAEDMNNG